MVFENATIGVDYSAEKFKCKLVKILGIEHIKAIGW
jgi:hypothetical protein